LPNRIAFAATANNLGRNDAVTDAQLAFYERRARGGVGLIVTEAFSVHRSSVPGPGYLRAFDEAVVPGLARMAETMHRHEAVVYGQLHHAGGKGYVPSLAAAAWGVSAARDFVSGTSPHRVTDEEVAELIRGFAASARNLDAAGFDGVELHAAHDFLLAQFLSPARNDRDDRWGGDLEGRCRILVEIVAGIRAATGSRFAVGVRLGASEFVEGGVDVEEAGRIVAWLQQRAPIDYLSVSQGSFGAPFDRHLPDMRFPDAPFVSLAERLAADAPGLPVMAVGKVPTVAAATRLLRESDVELIGMCRPLLADADLVRKARDGQRARPCVYCNRCWHELQSGRPAECFYGSSSSEGASDVGAPSPAAGRVRVVGGGLAGLELARLAALGGSEVTLYERRESFGGALALESRLPPRRRMGDAVDWLVWAAEDAGADLRASCEVDDALAATWGPDDAVVYAGGSATAIDALPGAENVAELTLEEALADPAAVGRRVAIVDGCDDEPVYALAELIAEGGREVAVLTPQERLAGGVSYVSRIGSLRRLDLLGVRLHLATVPVGVIDGELMVRHLYSEREASVGPVDTIVYAGPFASNPAPPGLPPGAMSIGDAYSPRPAENVVTEARRAARELRDR
jgi:dimethylglycine catabolism A